MSSQSFVFRRARRALLKSVAVAMALTPAASIFARVVPQTAELARIPVAADSRGVRRTFHIEHRYRSTFGLYK